MGGRTMAARASRTVRELIQKTNSGVISISPEADVLSALKTMAEKNIGAVIVIKDGKLAGILSERDCVRKIELAGRTAAEARVAEIMTANVVTVSPEHTYEECMLIMHEKRIRHLPVVEGGRVVGILSNRDVLEEVIAERETVIRELAKARLEATTYTGSY